MAEPVFSRIHDTPFDHYRYLLWGTPSHLPPPQSAEVIFVRDEVDRLVAAWKRERPDLDFSPLEVLSRITRIARHLDIARRKAFADLDARGFDVLTALRRAGEPYQLSPGQLMQETMVTSGTMTNRWDRLEESGLITRETDPNDGRGSLVTLTKTGMRAVDGAMEDLLKREREFLMPLSKSERVELASMLSKLAAPFDAKFDE
jgi:DNA-binding MarR family transcriptional regulator